MRITQTDKANFIKTWITFEFFDSLGVEVDVGPFFTALSFSNEEIVQVDRTYNTKAETELNRSGIAFGYRKLGGDFFDFSIVGKYVETFLKLEYLLANANKHRCDLTFSHYHYNSPNGEEMLVDNRTFNVTFEFDQQQVRRFFRGLGQNAGESLPFRCYRTNTLSLPSSPSGGVVIDSDTGIGGSDGGGFGG